MANRVFIIEPTEKDMRKAEVFGHLVYLWKHNEHRPSIWEESFEADLAAKFDEFKFDEYDYLLIVGSIIPICNAIHALSVSHLRQFKVLFWHATIQDYVCRSFNAEAD